MAAITLEELLKKVGVCPEKLDQSISDDNLLKIALFLTLWRTVARYLGLSDIDVNGVEREGGNEQERRLKALQKWKGKFVFKATYRRLVEVLLSLAMADVAEKVCSLLTGTVYLFYLNIHIIASFLGFYHLQTMRSWWWGRGGWEYHIHENSCIYS